MSPGRHALAKDSWGWELQSGAAGPNTVIRGLFRFKQDPSLEPLLTASRRSHNGMRAYWDPVSWEQTQLKKKLFVTWIERQDCEKDAEYSSKVCSVGGGLGLARGWCQLGLRSFSTASPPDFITTNWTLRGPPRNWDQEGVSQFLGGADFTDIVFTTKKRERNGITRVPRLIFSFCLKGKISNERWKEPKGMLFLMAPPDYMVRDGSRLTQRSSVVLKWSIRPRLLSSLKSSRLKWTSSRSNHRLRKPKGRMTQIWGLALSQKDLLLLAHPRTIKIDGEGNCLFISVAQALENAGGGLTTTARLGLLVLPHLQKHCEKM